MEETTEKIINDAYSSPYGQKDTDQKTSQSETNKKLLSNNDQVLVNATSYAISEDFSEQFQENVTTSMNSLCDKSSPSCHTIVGSIDKNSKKSRTTSKIKKYTNYSYEKPRNNNKQRCFNTQANDENNLDLNDTFENAISAGKIKTGIKKNLNHLLNFTYEKSNEHYEYQKFSKLFWSNNVTKDSHFTKEQFLQANCRFVVKRDEDYTPHLINPDLLVEWSKIEEIHIDSNELISCPICLYSPTVGKMTKCGHTFCWSCILHYLSLSDKPWRKCPICYESIYKADLKSLVQNQFDRNFKVGDTIQFELMFRSKSNMSTIFLPYILFDQFKLDEQKRKTISLELLNSDTYTSAKKYLKISSKSNNELLESIIDFERRQLNNQRQNEKDQPEVCFVDEALNLLDEREKSLKNSDDIKKTNRKYPSSDKKKDLNDIDKLTIGDLQNQSEKPNTETVYDTVQKKKTTQQGLNDSQDYVIFYQSTDGQRIYLNALNTRMLLSEYNAFTNFPKYLSAKIIAFESYFMSENNRKRFKYLSHLPLNSEFKIVEVELTEETISRHTLIIFEEEIHERKRLRERKLLKEKRIADRSDNKNLYDPHYYNTSAMNEHIPSTSITTNNYSYDFPEASTPPTTSGRGSGSSGAQIIKEKEQNPASFAQMTINQRNSGTSFMRNSEDINSKSTWPSLGSNYLVVNLPKQKSQLTNGWLSTAKMCSTLGSSIKTQGAPTPRSKNSLADYENEEIEESDYLPAPGYRESFFSAIDEKVIDSEKANKWKDELDTRERRTDESFQSKLTKKKKKTKKLLFST